MSEPQWDGRRGDKQCPHGYTKRAACHECRDEDANKAESDLDAALAEIERLTRELEMKQLVENRLRLSWDESDKDAKRLTHELEATSAELGVMVNVVRQLGGVQAEKNAECDRLRAALERVARWNEHFEYAFSQDIMEFAREALIGEPKP